LTDFVLFGVFNSSFQTVLHPILISPFLLSSENVFLTLYCTANDLVAPALLLTFN